MKTFQLPSGATLHLCEAPFEDAQALYEAVLVELRGVSINGGQSMQEMFKNFFCAGFSSPSVKKALTPCLARCLYEAGTEKLKIDKDTFQPTERRQDYLPTIMEVAKLNLDPFAKSLFAAFQLAIEIVDVTQMFGSATTSSSPS